MLSWIIIIALIIVLVILVQFSHFKHKFKIIFLIFLLLFFYLTFMKIVSNNSINLSTPSGFFQAFKAYLLWFGHVFDNLKILTGNAIKMDWVGNSTR